HETGPPCFKGPASNAPFCASHTWTDCSDRVARRFPSGLNTAVHTGSSCFIDGTSVRMVSESQILTRPLEQAVATHRPSGLKRAEYTLAPCGKCAIWLADLAFHNPAVLSTDAVSTRKPSGL